MILRSERNSCNREHGEEKKEPCSGAADSGARRLRTKIALLEAGSYSHNPGALLLHAHDLSAADKLPVRSRVGHGESHLDLGVKFGNKFAIKENAVEIKIADKSDVLCALS